MSRAAFRQADFERVVRGAMAAGGAVQIDMRSLVVTVIPAIHKPTPLDGINLSSGILLPGNLAPDGKENFDED